MVETQTTAHGLSRRHLLRGAGFTMGLPLLEAMTPAGKSAYADAPAISGGAVASPTRMACLFVPNGVIQENWIPKATEAIGDPEKTGKDSTLSDGQWQLSPSLQPLASLKSKVNVLSGLALDNGRAHKDGAGDHARGGSTFLTAARPVKTSSNIRLGTSVDQIAASQLKDQTRLPSIELGLETSRNAGSCDSGYSCAYSSNISWRNERQPMPKETIPRAAFERMFGSGDAASMQKQRQRRQSILDVVAADARRIMRDLGQTDRRKLDEYFSSVREIEQRIERTEAADAQAMPDLDVPFGRIDTFAEHAELMFDLMVVGFQTDTTRVATLMLDNAGGNRVYREIGVRGAHHGLSHHRDKDESVDQLKKVDRYLVEKLAMFLQKLEATDMGGVSLLDQSMVLYGSGIGDGNRHTHDNLPIVLAGSANGSIPTGRWIRYAEEQPMANLFLTMLDAMGTPAESIGDSTGRLPRVATS
ncbi:MAG: DUF1552 domain-containing protein [Planctomycetota bacterium]